MAGSEGGGYVNSSAFATRAAFKTSPGHARTSRREAGRHTDTKHHPTRLVILEGRGDVWLLETKRYQVRPQYGDIIREVSENMIHAQTITDFTLAAMVVNKCEKSEVA